MELEIKDYAPRIPGRGEQPDFAYITEPGNQNLGPGGNVFRSGMSTNSPGYTGNAHDTPSFQNAVSINRVPDDFVSSLGASAAQRRGEGPSEFAPSSSTNLSSSSGKGYTGGALGGDLVVDNAASGTNKAWQTETIVPGTLPGGGTATPSLVALILNQGKPEQLGVFGNYKTSDLVIMGGAAIFLTYTILKK
jgi:hypothetical protein